MYSCQTAKKVSREHRDKAKKVQKKVDKNNLSEKRLSVHDRALFQEAKKKELQSFFENEVWQFQTVKDAVPERTLTPRMLLKWSKNPDGSPRAKARLIVRGYADVDALQGGLQTSSPTTSRLARSVLMSISASLGWDLWTAEVATAFLQGLPQERKLWVKLPADALAILGATQDTRMLLLKPCYGQLDAPRRWYLEAVRRSTWTQATPSRPLLFPAVYEDEDVGWWFGSPTFRSGRALAMWHDLHVCMSTTCWVQDQVHLLRISSSSPSSRTTRMESRLQWITPSTCTRSSRFLMLNFYHIRLRNYVV